MRRLTNIVLAFLVLGFSNITAQTGAWLDQQPIRNWNTTSMNIPRPDRRLRPQVAQCSKTARAATFAQDRTLMQNGFWPVGPAQVHGATVVIIAARDFDGMCRPNEFQAFLFDARRLIGTFSPQLMNSRTDGALSWVRMISPTEFEAEYERFGPGDALCCPSRMQRVRFGVTGVGASALLRPDAVVTDGGGGDDGVALVGTRWRWERTVTPRNTINVGRPGDYTIDFRSGGIVNVRSDCNTGSGRFTVSGNSLRFSGIALSMMACPRGSQDQLFNRGLSDAATFSRQRDLLLIDLAGGGGTMHFSRVP